MHLRRLAQTAAGLLAVACGTGSEHATSYTDSARTIAEDFAELYSERGFERAAAIFHCPPEYTREEEVLDRAAVGGSLEILWELNGPVHTFGSFAGPSATLGAMTGCGTPAYWKTHPTVVKRVLETSQRESERGFLEFQFASIDGRLVLSNFSHSLPASHPEAMSRAQAFLTIKLAK
jgi:hypothetical protein